MRAQLRSAPAANDAPLLIGERLRHIAAEAPDRALYTHLSFDDQPPVRLTRGETWRRACAVAAEIEARGLRGRPVLMVYPAGPDFGPAFLGVLLAGAIAVPVPAPDFASQFDRLGRVAIDCEPGVILSTRKLIEKICPSLPSDSPLRSCQWLGSDTLAPGAAFDPAPVAPSDIALLQYTSGSTSEPKGVALTHANIAHNLEMLREAFQWDTGARIVSWLPHFHDMGLMAGIMSPVGGGGEAVLMSPRAFLQRPMRWLQAISDYRGQISGAPNFAYELCVSWAGREQRTPLDLSCWQSAFAGAEPVRMATLEAFADCFADEGFARSALTPCYGMAETTLLVTCKPFGAPPATHLLARDAVQRGEARPTADPKGLTLTGCGYPATGTRVRIVEPERRTALPARRIGEVWISGPQVAPGYWNREEDGGPFAMRLTEPDGGGWLRTGDLGFLTEDGELVFVDRLKDLIILNGQNFPCHDLELTAAASHPGLTADNCVAVGLEVGGKTHIGIVAELGSNAVEAQPQIASAIRASLFTTYSLAVRTIVFVPPRRLSRTTSGKLQRRQTAQRLSDGSLQSLAVHGEPWPAQPAIVSGDDRTP
jgi:acyl-CoA synthetase (AMP-forming)/AMP-acid ligase II